MIRASLLVLAVAVAGCSQAPAPPAFPAGEIVDLSHTFDSETVFWPTAEKFWLQKVSDGITADGYYYAANNFFSAEHGGTHLDAPVHFARGHDTVDRVPVTRLIGNAAVIDVTEASNRNPNYQITIADIQRAERDGGEIPPDVIVLLRTGFSQRWPDPAMYLGTAERGAAALKQLHFPGLHPDTATWLVVNRMVKAIGIDTASIDYGQSTLFETHRALFERDVPVFENLTGLERLPARGAVVIALPMKIGGGSGAPLRAIAVVP